MLIMVLAGAGMTIMVLAWAGMLIMVLAWKAPIHHFPPNKQNTRF